MALSSQQQAVVDWVLTGKGSLKLIARAGCGKTFTLMAAIQAIAENNMGEALLMAYNKSIAQELKAKLEGLQINWKVATANTVHSTGYNVWAKQMTTPRAQHIDEKKVYKLIDKKVNKDAHQCIYRDLGPVIAKVVSYAKGQAFGHLVPIESREAWFQLWDHFGLDQELAGGYEALDVIRAAVCIYKQSLNLCREVIDFDDMILAPLYHKARFWPKDWILLDESQDTNPARRALALAMLKPRTGRMIFVGDDRQAIYGFTGADSDAMDQLQEATQAIELPLNVTYRCPKAVVAVAQDIVPDITAHETAPDGIVRSLTRKEFDKERLTKFDVILCRNTAPLISQAYALISRGVPCKVEGREIGTGLIKLARRWKIEKLDELQDKLRDYQVAEAAKLMSQDKESQIEALNDKVECLNIMIDRCLLTQKYTVAELCLSIEKMFGDTKEGQSPDVLTLSTIHKSKGREWPRVFILGRARYLPSPYAKKPWQQVQESNLEYVAVTRAMNELIDVEVPFNDEEEEE